MREKDWLDKTEQSIRVAAEVSILAAAMISLFGHALGDFVYRIIVAALMIAGTLSFFWALDLLSSGTGVSSNVLFAVIVNIAFWGFIAFAVLATKRDKRKADKSNDAGTT